MEALLAGLGNVKYCPLKRLQGGYTLQAKPVKPR